MEGNNSTLANLKNLFKKFVAVTNNIKALNDENVLTPGYEVSSIDTSDVSNQMSSLQLQEKELGITTESISLSMNLTVGANGPVPVLDMCENVDIDCSNIVDNEICILPLQCYKDFGTIRRNVNLTVEAKGPVSYLDICQIGNMDRKNTVMGIDLPDDSTFYESRFEQFLHRVSQGNLTNYLYYLCDDNDSYDMLDHSLKPDNNHIISCSESMEEEHSVIESRDYDTEVVSSYDMFEHGLEPDNNHIIGCAEMMEEEPSIVESRDYDTLDHSSELDNNHTISGPEMTEEKPSQVESSDYDNDQSGTTYAGVDVQTQQQSTNANGEPCYISAINVKSHRGCDNEKMYVPTSDLGRYTKKLCCIYCLKRYPKLARHLKTVHKNEADVIKFQGLPIGSKERRICIAKIRKMGQFEWNTNGKINGGELQTCRRPNKRLGKTALDYLTCAHCKGQLSTTVLRVHWNICSKDSFPGERIVKELGRAVEGRLHVDACKVLCTQIFAKMRQDKTTLSIRYDWLVIAFGNNLCSKYDDTQYKMIRGKLKRAGHMLNALRSICPDITDFASLYKTEHCDAVIEAIRTVAKFDSKLNTCKSPGTASALITLVKDIGKVLLIRLMKLKTKDKDREDCVSRFNTVFEEDVKTKLRKMLTVTKAKIRREKDENIPSIEDVDKLSTYLDRERDECFVELTQQYSFDSWLYLLRLTAISVLLFNRKRVGDTENILVGDFHRRVIVPATTVSKKNEIKSRMKVKGKLWRTVPILLKHSYDECLDLILRYRKDAGVPDNNEFLFGLPSKTDTKKKIEACVLFRKFSEACGAENPSSLRGTNLRKHFASLCSTLKLSDQDIAIISKYMGHSKDVHQEYYRHNTLQQEVGVSNYLEIARGKKKMNSTRKRKNNKVNVVANQNLQKRKQIRNVGQVGYCNVKAVTKRKPQQKGVKMNSIRKSQKRNEI